MSAQQIADFFPVEGVRIASVDAGVSRHERDDVALFEIAAGGSAAALFTRNAFCAAPVTLAREHIAQRAPRYLVINSGNANAGMGSRGLADAATCCRAVADATGVAQEEILPFSTGVIGEPLPVDRIASRIPELLQGLRGDRWPDAARAIMTTDTRPKLRSLRRDLGAREITLTGIAKGSGMIRPDLATLLVFLATDAAVDKVLLERLLNDAVEGSFNRITIDGDTSTNDSCILLATGRSGVSVAADTPECAEFAGMLNEVCRTLALEIVRDGEGATKFIEIEVVRGRDAAECRRVAYTVAESPLVKTAMFASDANWGRILAAVGRAGVDALDVGRVSIDLGDVRIVDRGERDAGYTEERGAAVMRGPEIRVRIDLDRGDATDTVWTSDLSHDYVRINAEYRT